MECEARVVGMLELLDHCDAVMTAAASQLWDMNRDLAIELNRRAQRCRLEAEKWKQPNAESSDRE